MGRAENRQRQGKSVGVADPLVGLLPVDSGVRLAGGLRPMMLCPEFLLPPSLCPAAAEGVFKEPEYELDDPPHQHHGEVEQYAEEKPLNPTTHASNPFRLLGQSKARKNAVVRKSCGISNPSYGSPPRYYLADPSTEKMHQFSLALF